MFSTDAIVMETPLGKKRPACTDDDGGAEGAAGAGVGGAGRKKKAKTVREMAKKGRSGKTTPMPGQES